MKRKFMAMVLVLALCLSLCVGASAASDSDSGKIGSTVCTGTLNVDRERGIARTSWSGGGSMTAATTINFYYTNSNGQTSVSSDYGTTYASAGNSLSKGTRASSQHRVVSQTGLGSWSCTLNASV